MTAPVDVLVALDRAISRNLERGAAKGSPSDKELRSARAVVAALIAACDERDSARRAYDKSPHETGPMLARVLDADKRYFAALAACKPATGA